MRLAFLGLDPGASLGTACFLGPVWGAGEDSTAWVVVVVESPG